MFSMKLDWIDKTVYLPLKTCCLWPSFPSLNGSSNHGYTQAGVVISWVGQQIE